MIRLAYDPDLINDQWEILNPLSCRAFYGGFPAERTPLIPPAKLGGRPRTTEMREVLNAIFYLLANGIKWRAMPHDLPKWQSVYTYLRAWEADGT
jgi:putative transposase